MTFLKYYQQLCVEIAQNNRSVAGRNSPNTYFSFPSISEEQLKTFGGDNVPQDIVPAENDNLRHCGNHQIMVDDEDVEWE